MRSDYLQLTMRTKPTSNESKKQTDQPLSTLLRINGQYAHLLQQLAQNNTRASKMSPQAYLFDTLQNIKQLNSCMKQQLRQYGQFCSPSLQHFLQRKQLSNAGNLIGKYQSLSDEIQTFKARIRELEDSNSQQKIYEALTQEEQMLEVELKKLINKRVDLRNKNEMIEHQIECGEKDLNRLKVGNYEQEMQGWLYVENQGKWKVDIIFPIIVNDMIEFIKNYEQLKLRNFILGISYDFCVYKVNILRYFLLSDQIKQTLVYLLLYIGVFQHQLTINWPFQCPIIVSNEILNQSRKLFSKISLANTCAINMQYQLDCDNTLDQ